MDSGPTIAPEAALPLWVSLTCEGCGGAVMRRRRHHLRHLRRSKSGLVFCGECSRNGIANRVRHAAIASERERAVSEGRGLSYEELAERLGVSKSTVGNYARALGQDRRAGPRRKHSLPVERPCAYCAARFTPHDGSQVARGYGNYCSRRCARLATRERAREIAAERHRRADEELAHLNAAGYMTVRQAAEEVKVVESTLHRYIEEGHLTVAERRVCEGEHWSLVTRRDVERFRADEWPRLRRRAVELMWPRVSRRWGSTARRRWLTRAGGYAAGKQGGRPRAYSDEKAREVVELRERNPKLGERGIAARLGLSKRQVHEILVAAREVVRNPS